MEEKLIKIDLIRLDEEVYPRFYVDWFTALQYYDALKSGSVFPPIVVGRIKRKKGYVLIDGAHRIEAYKKNKEKYIKAIIKTYNNKVEAFKDAVKYNSMHGRVLSNQEKVRIIDKLLEYGVSKEEISQIVKVSIDTINRFIGNRVVKDLDGEKIYLKGAMEKAMRKTMKHLQPQEIEIAQERLAEMEQRQLLYKLRNLLITGAIAVKDAEIKALLMDIYKLIEEKVLVRV